ncbi:hypothetical protein OHA21_38115 [Actinoplanes sp. NBC_00393]|uniref:hypothetical protein n=1 Tax=Actinoplanes sp. NBC_00393 TaxID=2975953 RepID=UPI002E1CB1ED
MSKPTRVLSWVFRPAVNRPADIQTLAGASIFEVGHAGADGTALVVLRDGSRVRAQRSEIVME